MLANTNIKTFFNSAVFVINIILFIYFLRQSKIKPLSVKCSSQNWEVNENPAVKRSLVNSAECHEDGLGDLTLFLTLPPTMSGIEECRQFLLPTLRIFWPFQYAQLKIVVVLDGEAKEIDKYAAIIRTEVENLLPNSTQIIINYNFPTVKFGRGWDRQQWIMFWADNFTTSDYVGFVDSDAIFVTRILPKDLFQNGKPVVRGLFGKPYDDWWSKVPKASTKAIGKLEPFNCMTYFPVILKTDDLKSIRARIMKQFDNATNFDTAYEKMMAYSGGIYSQFSIMCNFLFNYRQNQYHWTLYERRLKDAQGPFLDTQSGWTSDIRRHFDKSRWRPGISAHWSYEKYKKDIGNLNNVVQTGVCNSMPELSSLCGNNTKNRRLENINDYEWTFEGYNWALADGEMAYKAHRTKLAEIGQCPAKYDSGLLQVLSGYF